MSNTLEPPPSEGEVSAEAAPRLDAVLKMLKLELVTARVGGPERSRGFNPYESRPGRASRDLWGRRRRA